jgi:tetratricopeptide repeat protein
MTPGRARTPSSTSRSPAVNDEPAWPWRLGLLALFGVAAIWRCAYLVRLGHTPFAGSLDADARIYWAWSESILRNGPLPPSPFFLAPLYPYALAGVRAVVGGNMDHVLAAQVLLGTAAVVLLADATRRLASWPVALAVGGLLAFSRSSTFFDGLVLPESMLFFVESLLVWFVARTDWSQARILRYAVYGLLVGVLAQGRASHSVLLALVLPVAWAGSRRPARRLMAVAVSVATFALVCLPAMLANLRASGELIPFTYNMGFNLYVGNNPDADGAYVDITRGSIPVPLEGSSPTTGGALDGRAYLLGTEGRRLSAAGSSARWAGKAAAFVGSAPTRALGLAGRKLLLAWNRREIPQIERMESFARAAGPLGLPLLGSFGFIAILGLSGVVWAARGSAAERWLVGYLALVSLAMVPFFVTDRYRHHLVPGLAVLAGIAIAGIVRAARAGTGRARVRSLLAVSVATGIVFAPIGARRPPVGDWVYVVDQAIRLLDRGAYAEAAEALARAEATLGDMNARSLSTSARTDLAVFYSRYAIALEAIGRHDQAIVRWERAIALDPNDAESLSRLLVAYELAGRATDAARARRTLGSIPGGRGRLLLNEGWSAAGRGDVAGAERLFLEAVQAAPNLPMAWTGLIRLRIQAGRFEEASRALDGARAAGLDLSTADAFECFLAARRGDLAAARRALDRLPSGFTPTDPFVAGLLDDGRRAVEREPTAR